MEELNTNSVSWTCRFHLTEGFHEIGCPHQEWTKEQLYKALLTQKKSNEQLWKK